MLIHEFDRNIDEKGRLNFPSKLRGELGAQFIVCMGLDKYNKCLFAYSLEEWDVLKQKIQRLPFSKAAAQREIYASAMIAQPDAQGRIVISEKLRKYAELSKDIRIIGVSNHAEIWDSAARERSSQQFDMASFIDALDAERDN
ncbi:MAG: division/cell wall cluster transcriptional repressor MraZ [Oscillospiraceae bacterium]|nr:division/cell wall cluster transcriptional repressor MraZ [Oscillospiraceae bacterium]